MITLLFVKHSIPGYWNGDQLKVSYNTIREKLIRADLLCVPNKKKKKKWRRRTDWAKKRVESHLTSTSPSKETATVRSLDPEEE